MLAICLWHQINPRRTRTSVNSFGPTGGDKRYQRRDASDDQSRSLGRDVNRLSGKVRNEGDKGD